MHLGSQPASSATRARDAAFASFEQTERAQQLEARTAAIQTRIAQQQRAARTAQRTALAQQRAQKAQAAAAATKALAARKQAEARARAWQMPIKGAPFTSGFGMRWGRMHAGNDFGAPVGTPLSAMSTGTVIFAGGESGYGNLLKIRYWDGTVSFYGHMSRITARVGQAVSPGEVVGYSGNTGHSTGPHLHLEIHPHGGAAVNPAPWLRAHGLQ